MNHYTRNWNKFFLIFLVLLPKVELTILYLLETLEMFHLGKYFE
jgi:hypothetical protein